jgi:hypothetical protein
VSKTRSKKNQERPVVSIRHIAMVNSDTRISRAIDILLKATAEAGSRTKDTSNGKKEMPHGQAHTEDTLTRGSSGNDSHGEE